ncbi:hypothetical protein AYL99_05364 [Fonsecaea erecta]|uniref:Uncharacterized protein n=1 Tax=Fonsecaea erecta TaxID=1367422 RepID=A0A178ZL18_9EURO|nr:hypothetical protein AYL99_05364 [Fonsecaea erecta]OAP60362.1 hypothetical protein AYL99_05364 [Fonsecaea erecta]
MDTLGEAEAEAEAGAGEASNTSTHTNDNATTPTFRDFTLDNSKVLSPPKGERTKTDIAFGDQGTIGYISEDGELVMMTKYLDVGNTGMVTAAAQVSEAVLVMVLGEQLSATAGGIGLRPYHYIDDPRVEFVHDRWPRVSFILQEIAQVTVQYIVQDGCVIQQYVVKSLSDEPQELVFRIDMDIGLWPTSHVRQQYDVYDNSDMTLESDPEDPVVRRKGEPKPKPGFDFPSPSIGELVLSFALFEDGKAINVEFESSNLFAYYTIELSENQTHELTAKYHLGAKESGIEPDVDIQKYVDVCSFLTQESEQYGSWNWDPKDVSGFVLRRTLEHILSVCAVPMAREGEKSALIAITDGEMLDPTLLYSSPFRFLTRMSELLKSDTKNTIADPKLKDYLQRRIKHTCIGALRWWYDHAEVDDDGGWFQTPYFISGKRMPGPPEPGRFLTPLIEMFHEFITAFPEEQTLVEKSLQQKQVTCFLEGVWKQRHKASKLWIDKEISHSIDWYDHDYNDNNEIKLPHYSLVFLICLWRSLRFLQKICETRELESTPNRGVSSRIKLPSAPPTPAVSTQKRNLSITSIDMDPRQLIAQEGGGSHSDPKNTEMQDPLEELNKRMNEELDDCRKEINDCLQRLDPAAIRSKIFERFIFTPPATNPDSDSRGENSAWIAVCRSARSLIPRSDFHRSDYRLSDAVNWGFFDDESGGLLPAWVETVKLQDKTDNDWDSPIYYAFAISRSDQEHLDSGSDPTGEGGKNSLAARDGSILDGKQQRSTNSTLERDKSVTDTSGGSESSSKVVTFEDKDKESPSRVQYFRHTLLRSALSSGLLAHDLDVSRRPVQVVYPFQPELRYEAAYRLLASDFKAILPRTQKLVVSRLDILEVDKDDKQTRRDKEDLSEERRKALKRKRKARTGKMPIISQAGEKRIVEYPELEWLYHEMPCFRERDKVDIRGQESSPSDRALPKTLRTELEKLRKLTVQNEGEVEQPTVDDLKALAIDVRRNTNMRAVPNMKQLWKESLLKDSSELDNFLRDTRTRDEAKKRLIMLYSPTNYSVLVVYARCPPSEQSSIARFIKRHAKFSNMASKATSRLANLWTTELHISFFKIFSREITLDNQEAEFVNLSSNYRLDGPSKSHFLCRATRSFRTVGDMYDRSWTCWVLSAVPEEKTDSDEEVSPWEYSSDDDSAGGKKLPWNKWMSIANDEFHHQRTVLEIRLFEKIAKEALASTKAVLHTVDEYLNHQVIRFPPGASNSSFIFGSKRNLEMYAQIIALLKGFQNNSEAINKAAKDWNEGGPQASEKPRWSKSDEAKYGTKLSQESGRSRRTIDDLLEQSEKIRNKILEVERANERTISELSVNLTIVQSRTDENVRLFTYATVIFLPLGFSSSLFSMGGSPSHTTIRAFAVTVFVVLVVTVMMLMNVKSFAWGAQELTDSFIDGTQGRMEKSTNVFWGGKAKALKEQRLREEGYLQSQSPEKDSEKRSGKSSKLPVPETEKPPPSKLWYLGFWAWSCFAIVILPVTWTSRALTKLKQASGREKEDTSDNGDSDEEIEGNSTNSDAPSSRHMGPMGRDRRFPIRRMLRKDNSKTVVTTEIRSKASSSPRSTDQQQEVDIEAQASRGASIHFAE